MSGSIDKTRKFQFSLPGLLWFVVACSAYFSMIGETIRELQNEHEPQWRLVTTILVCWAILFFFLRSKGVRGMLVAHCAMPTLVLILCAFAGPKGSRLSDEAWELCVGLAIVCFATSLLTFPASVLRMVVVALRRK